MGAPTLVLDAPTVDVTRAIGAALASVLRPGDAVVLTGELGAGKTTLVQGVAEALGVEDHVASPTFTLVKEYRGRLDLAHVDVYRLDRIQDVVDLGLDDLTSAGAVLLVEWGDVVDELLSADRLRLELTTVDPSGEDETRRIGLRAEGPSWVERWPALEAAIHARVGATVGDPTDRSEAP